MGHEIDRVFVGPSTVNIWGADVLGRDMSPAASQTAIVSTEGTRGCAWRLSEMPGDGGRAEWRNPDLCGISRVMLFRNWQANATRAVTE